MRTSEPQQGSALVFKDPLFQEYVTVYPRRECQTISEKERKFRGIEKMHDSKSTPMISSIRHTTRLPGGATAQQLQTNPVDIYIISHTSSIILLLKTTVDRDKTTALYERHPLNDMQVPSWSNIGTKSQILLSAFNGGGRRTLTKHSCHPTLCCFQPTRKPNQEGQTNKLRVDIKPAVVSPSNTRW